MQRGSRWGLTSKLKDELIRRGRERLAGTTAETTPDRPVHKVADEFLKFEMQPGYRQLRLMSEHGARLGFASPFFKIHDGIAGARTRIAGREYLNFSSYNYLDLNGHPAVSQAARAAIGQFGTSVSASRPVSGERPLHRALEQALARAHDCDDAIVFVSGHATNVTVIGHLLGQRDLVLHDELIHNSTLQGIQLSGAHRLSFPHNDWRALDTLLTGQRPDFERVLIVVEGIYSMDGDFPDLPRFIEVKRRHGAWLMVDEAHSFGVMGRRGGGIREHFGLPGREVDIWMGTLSKALAACGGYIAGPAALIEQLKFLAPGFLYSVGMAPPVAAAALAALEVLQAEPGRVASLHARSQQFVEAARARGIDVGHSAGIAVIPAILGSSLRTVRISSRLFERGINVQPILYPAVAERMARLRFFISSAHTESDIDTVVEALASAIREA
jgi:8-amino-7-oxononanoate synthase